MTRSGLLVAPLLSRRRGRLAALFVDDVADVLDRVLHVLDRAAARERHDLANLRADVLPMRRQLRREALHLARHDVADAADQAADERHDEQHADDARHAQPVEPRDERAQAETSAAPRAPAARERPGPK